MEVPRQIMAAAHAALDLTSRAGEQCKKHLVSDLLVVVEFLGAALEGAYHIARANLPLLKDLEAREDWTRMLAQSARQGRTAWDKTKEALAAR